MAVAGASRYLTASTLANTQGRSPSIPSLLGETGTLGLLDAGRNLSNNGVGLSASSRSAVNKFLSETSGSYNSIFTLGAGPSLSTEGLQIQILGKRASVPRSQISDQVLAAEAAQAEEESKNARAAIVEEVLNSVKYKFGLGQRELDELLERSLRRAGYGSNGQLIDESA